MKFEETETYKNLQKALQGEALAHLKYQWYKSQLSDFNKGYDNILDEIIHNEKEHGKIWFKTLHDGMPNNNENLLDAIAGETYEATEMYIDFGNTANREGFTDIAKLFLMVANIEKHHAEKFKGIQEEINNDLFKGNEDTVWKCLNCGHIVKRKEAPVECPVCNHPQKYFTKKEE